MHIYKTRQFDKWASKEGLTDSTLQAAVAEMENGLIDADLGGHVVKKRVALPGRGKSAGARTLLAYRMGDCAFFVYGFAKNERDNIDDKELKALKQLAAIQLGLNQAQLAHALIEGKLIKVNNHD
jgi:hypothetical protein